MAQLISLGAKFLMDKGKKVLQPPPPSADSKTTLCVCVGVLGVCSKLKASLKKASK